MQDKSSQKAQAAIVSSLKRAQQTGVFTLADKEITAFPPELCHLDEQNLETKWWEISHLSKIDLSNNKIKEIPPEIAQIIDLVALRMINNCLESLPDELFTLEYLKMLDFTHNSLTYIPESVYKGYSLVELSLSDNKIQTLPQGLTGCKNLEKVDFSQNQITSLDIDLSSLQKLKIINLAENRLTSLPQSLGNLIYLEQLLLSKNQIREIPQQSVSQLRNLKMLDLKENKLKQFTEFPRSEVFDSVILGFNALTHVEGYENCPSLSVLDVKNNKLVSLQPSIYNLKALRTLDISNNDLSDIPSEVGFMKSLVRISLEGNPLKCIRSSIKSSGAENLKKFLRDRAGGSLAIPEKDLNDVRAVDTWGQYVRDFLCGKELVIIGHPLNIMHDRFCEITVLTTLELSNANLKEINPNLSQLTNLTKLRLNGNRISYLDPRIFIRLQNLEELEIRENTLDNFFEEVAGYPDVPLPQLAYLDISNNRFQAIPTILRRYQQLRVLVMAYNGVSSLEPLFHPSMQALETLDFSNNKLSDISENVLVLKNLENLNLENNSLDKLPTFVGYLPKMKSVKLMGNMIKIVKRNILEKGGKQMVEYLKERHPTPINTQQMYSEEPTENKNPDYQASRYQSQPNVQQNMRNDPNSYQRQMDIENSGPQRQMRARQVPFEENKVAYDSGQYYQSQPKTENSGVTRERQNAVQKEVQIMGDQIAALEHELQENFTLSTVQIMNKKREINKLRAARTQALNSIKP